MESGKVRDLATSGLLASLPGATPAGKEALIQALYARTAFSPSGIMYSMQHLAGGEVHAGNKWLRRTRVLALPVAVRVETCDGGILSR